MSIDPNLLSKLLNQLTKMINSRGEMAGWLKDFIEDIRKQEIAINSTKTGAAALGVVSTIGLFTPFAPLAVAGLVTAGGAGVATSIGDLIANKVKGGNLEEKVNKMKTEDAELEKLQKILDEHATRLAKELEISKEDAVLFVLVGVPKMVAQAGLQVVRGGVEMVKLLPHLRAINDAMRLGASFGQAVRLGNTVFQGTRATVTGVGGVARVGTTFAVTTATKLLGGFGAVIGIADAIYSWTSKNPNRASAEKLLSQLQDNVKALQNYKTQLLELQKI